MFVIRSPILASASSSIQKSQENTSNISEIPVNQKSQSLASPSQIQNTRATSKTIKKLNLSFITDIDVQQNSIITLEELNGELLKDKIIKINAAGLVTGGLRRKKDGVTNFGPISEQNGNVINDYVINIPQNLNEVIPTLFSINFNLLEKTYYLCPSFVDNCGDAAIFMKIDSKLKVDKKLFLSLGEVHFSVETSENETHKIEIEITYDANTTKKFEFDQTKKVITIGRGKKCDILLYHLSYSRIQTTFWYYDKEESWFIEDGNEEKKSTNGTWAFLNWNWRIEEDVQFRIGQNLLKLSIDK